MDTFSWCFNFNENTYLLIQIIRYAIITPLQVTLPHHAEIL